MGGNNCGGPHHRNRRRNPDRSHRVNDLPWYERMRAGFQKTSDRLGDNLTGLFTKATLDEETLDEIEEALIASDLGPATAAKIRDRLAGERFERGLSEYAV